MDSMRSTSIKPFPLRFRPAPSLTDVLAVDIDPRRRSPIELDFIEFETDDDAEEDDSGYRPALFCAFGDAKLPNLSAMRLIIRSTSCLLGGNLERLCERVVKEPRLCGVVLCGSHKYKV